MARRSRYNYGDRGLATHQIAQTSGFHIGVLMLMAPQSELVVNSDHAAQFNPDAIQEVKRFLKTYP